MVARYLGPASVRERLAAFHPDVQAAIRQKRLIAGMRADAARMAWGYPLQIHRSLEAGVRRERWTYEGGAVVEVENDHVVRWTEAPRAP